MTHPEEEELLLPVLAMLPTLCPESLLLVLDSLFLLSLSLESCNDGDKILRRSDIIKQVTLMHSQTFLLSTEIIFTLERAECESREQRRVERG